MRKIIVTEFITLDGVIEAPGGNETDHPHGGWQRAYADPEIGAYKVEELSSVDSLLLGRKTYDVFASYWPGHAGEPFGDRINRYPKYVVTNSLDRTEWQNTHIIRHLPAEIAALKNTDGGNILVYGSATLVKSLLAHQLVDELRLMVYPLAVGGGMRLFNDQLDLQKFHLKNSRAVKAGILMLEYEPIR